ncbi:MAG: hypothetical protein JKY94_02010 [Rhodobacteraceae bacterium]|nr:hypothetical protein [Paracoccaceae bacterium]
MAQSDYLIILFALVIYRPLKLAALLGKPRMLHDWSDLLGTRHEGTLRLLDRYFLSRWVPPVTLTAFSLLACPVASWTAIDPTHSLRILVGLSSVMLAWKSVTCDIDLATGRKLIIERLVVVFAAAGVIAYPGFLFLLLFTAINYFRGWQHHQHLQIRILLLILASWIGFVILSAFGDIRPITSAGLFVSLLVIGAQYLVPGISKCRLGRRWYSWAWHNRLDYLPVAAYCWGWRRFLSEERVIRWTRVLVKMNRPMQISVMALEIAMAFTMFDRRMAVLILGAMALFHLAVFVLAGLLFWQNIAVLTAMAGLLLFLPEAVSDQLFGPVNGTLGCTLMFGLTYGVRLWRPLKLSWWDTPLISRTDWIVEGVSGKLYGLYNDFLEPNDRIFGNKSGYFLSHHKRLTEHSGHAVTWAVASAIYESLSSPKRLKEEIERLGEDPYDEHQRSEHDRYMLAFLTNFNLGKPKRVCPAWLKAPGDQYCRWGQLPRFLGQEQVDRLSMRHREEVFDGNRIVTLRDELIMVIDIPTSSDESEPVLER